jgi:hypothetical protein
MKKRSGVSFSGFFKNNFGLVFFYWKNTFYTAKHIFPKFFSISFATYRKFASRKINANGHGTAQSKF